MEGREREEPVLDAVLREDCDGPLGAQPAIQQTLCDSLDSGERLGVRHCAPRAGRVPAGEEHALRRHARPVDEALRDGARIRPERDARAKQHGAVGPDARLDVDRPEGGLPEGGRRHSSPTFLACLVRNSRSRCLASGASCEMAAMSDSKRRP